MTERPILFSAPMVRAILAGRKTQTRRILKHPHAADVDVWAQTDSLGYWDGGVHEAGNTALMTTLRCPYGALGDLLWVRETWAWPGEEEVLYRASHQHLHDKMRTDPNYPQWKWRPSIHMPRKFSRIKLEVTGVRVERLQDISVDDAIAEGVTCWLCNGPVDGTSENECSCFHNKREARESFQALWTVIHGAESWNANPWVWAISFTPTSEKESAS